MRNRTRTQPVRSNSARTGNTTVARRIRGAAAGSSAKPPQPLEPERSERAGRPALEARPHVERAAHADHDADRREARRRGARSSAPAWARRARPGRSWATPNGSLDDLVLAVGGLGEAVLADRGAGARGHDLESGRARHRAAERSATSGCCRRTPRSRRARRPAAAAAPAISDPGPPPDRTPVPQRLHDRDARPVGEREVGRTQDVRVPGVLAGVEEDLGLGVKIRNARCAVEEPSSRRRAELLDRCELVQPDAEDHRAHEGPTSSARVNHGRTVCSRSAPQVRRRLGVVAPRAAPVFKPLAHRSRAGGSRVRGGRRRRAARASPVDLAQAARDVLLGRLELRVGASRTARSAVARSPPSSPPTTSSNVPTTRSPRWATQRLVERAEPAEQVRVRPRGWRIRLLTTAPWVRGSAPARVRPTGSPRSRAPEACVWCAMRRRSRLLREAERRDRERRRAARVGLARGGQSASRPARLAAQPSQRHGERGVRSESRHDRILDPVHARMLPLGRSGRSGGTIATGDTARVRIAIDARPASDAEPTGVGHYTRRMLAHLPAAMPSDELVAWHPRAEGS